MEQWQAWQELAQTYNINHCVFTGGASSQLCRPLLRVLFGSGDGSDDFRRSADRGGRCLRRLLRPLVAGHRGGAPAQLQAKSETGHHIYLFRAGTIASAPQVSLLLLQITTLGFFISNYFISN